MIGVRRDKGRYKKPEYIAYEYEMKPQLIKLKPIKDKTTPISVIITFNVAGGVSGDVYRVYKPATNYILKTYSDKEQALQRAGELVGYEVEYVPLTLSYGVTGDTDNIIKPIHDFVEALGIIPNDRQIRYNQVMYTYQNDVNSFDIEVRPLSIIKSDKGVVSFK